MIRFILFVLLFLINLQAKEDKDFLAIHPLGLLLQTNSPLVTLNKKEKEFLKQNPKIIIGSDTSWFPYVYKTKNKELIGLNVDIINKINQLTGANFQLELGFWKDMVKKAKEKKIDGLSPSTIHKEREVFFNFSIPFASHYSSVVVKHGNPLNIKSKKDLENRTIVIQKGNLFLEKLSKKLFPKSKIIYRDSYESVFEEVIYGVADATINEATTTILKNEKGIPHLNIAFTLDEKSKLHFSIRKDWPEAISIINKGINAIPKEEMEDIKYKWIGEFHFDLDSKGLSSVDKDYIKKIKKIRVCVNPAWYSFSKDKKYDKNISIDFLEKVLNKIGLQKELVYTKTWKESLEFLKMRKCDLIPIIKEAKERREYINFTKPYINYPVMIVTHNDIPYLYNLDYLKDKKIAVIKDNAIIEIIKEKYKNIDLVLIENSLEGLKKVKEKEVFAYIDLLPVFIPIFNKVENIKINRELGVTLDLSMGVRSDDEHLFHILEKSLNTISNKEKDNIFNKLIELAYQEKINYTLIFQILSFLIFIILLIIYWNFQLKKGINKALLKNKEQEILLYHYSKQDAMKDLVGNISHQWKQPVNELSSVLFYIETKLHLNQKITEEDIENTSLKSRKIIDYLSKTVSTFSNFYINNDSEENISIVTLLEQAIFIIEGSLKKYKVEIKLDIKGNGFKVKGEELQQVILSILNNAKNIIIEREISKPIILIKLYERGEELIIIIEDNFGGIKKINENIFELGISSAKKGTGLGLYISKRIIEDKYKGEISVDNKNLGARFLIKIPKIN